MKLQMSMFRKKNKEKSVSVIWQITVPYILLFLLFTVFMHSVLQFSNKKLQDEVFVRNQNTFHVISSNITSLKYSLDTFAQQQNSNSLLKSVGQEYEWNDGDVYYDIVDLKKSLSATLFPKNSINEIGIYFPNSDRFLIDGNIFKASKEYERFYFSNHMPVEKSYSDWKAFMLDSHSFEMYRSDDGKLIYLHSVTKNNQTLALILLTVNQQFFQSLLPNHENSGMILYNHFNEEIYSSQGYRAENPFSNQLPDFSQESEKVEFNNHSYIRFSSKPAAQLGVLYYIPETEFYKSVKKVIAFLYYLMLIFTLLILFLASYFSKKQYKPIEKITNMLKPLLPSEDARRQNVKNEYVFIQNSLQELSEKLQKNEAIINKQNKSLFEETLRKYITSSHSTICLSNLFDIYQVHFSHLSYIAAIVTTSYINEEVWYLPKDRDLIFTAVDNLLNDYSGELYQNFYVSLGEETALIFIGTDIMDEKKIFADIKNFFTEVRHFCTEKLGFEFYVQISNLFSKIDDTKAVYNNMRNIHYMNPQESVNFCKEIERNSSYDYEFLETGEKLLRNYLEHSDSKAGKRVLSRLYEEHLNSVSVAFLSYVNIRIASIFSDFFKNMETQNEQKYLNLLNEVNVKENCLNAFFALTEYICKESSFSANNENIKLSVSIAKYVEENFSDSSLNVNALSYVFQKTPSYLSRLFKNETGKMLNQYITEIRLQHAETLLLSNKKIDDIASDCGFSDITTFRRSFKRFIGVAPSEYRRNLESKQK